MTTLQQQVVTRLMADLVSVATAESLTGGLLCATLVDVPGASAVVRGGVIAYATDLKTQLLGVDAGLLARVGPVEGGVAEQMATGARHRLGAQLGVSTTGVAGPEAADGHPAGTVYIGISAGWLDGGSRHRRLFLDGGRPAVRAATVREALLEILDVLVAQ